MMSEAGGNQTPGRVVAEYLESSAPEAIRHTDELAHNANAAFRTIDPQGVVTPPIAAHYEKPETVWHALHTQRQQLMRGNPPVWIVALVNNPASAPSGTGEICDTIRTFQADFPELPLTFAEHTFPERPKAGRLKKMASDLGLAVLRSHFGENLPERIALMSQDIDTIRLSPQYNRRLLKPVLDQGYAVSQANVRHENSGGRFPNMDQVLFWYDLQIAMNPFAWHDAHNAILADAYCRFRGYDPDLDMGEGILLQKKITHLPSDLKRILLRNAGVYAAVSPRRPFAYLQQGISPTEMWSQDFSLEDTYRHMSLDDMQDISSSTAKEILVHLMREGSDMYGVQPTLDRTQRSLRSHWAALVSHRYFALREQVDRFAVSEVALWRQAEQDIEQLKRTGRFILQTIANYQAQQG